MRAIVCPHCNKVIEPNMLTQRELEIAKLKAKGLTGSQIGKALYISEKTVKNHMGSIYSKTEKTNIMELVKYLLDNKLISAEDIGT
jgi:DNA-binding NarL/FixJ family response regulator